MRDKRGRERKGKREKGEDENEENPKKRILILHLNDFGVCGKIRNSKKLVGGKIYPSIFVIRVSPSLQFCIKYQSWSLLFRGVIGFDLLVR